MTLFFSHALSTGLFAVLTKCTLIAFCKYLLQNWKHTGSTLGGRGERLVHCFIFYQGLSFSPEKHIVVFRLLPISKWISGYSWNVAMCHEFRMRFRCNHLSSFLDMPFLILERGRVRKWRSFIVVDFFPNLRHHFFYIMLHFVIAYG